jgi:hypothetical protein
MENRLTPATLAAAKRLEMDPEKLADILDVYNQEAARIARERKAARPRRGIAADIDRIWKD